MKNPHIALLATTFISFSALPFESEVEIVSPKGIVYSNFPDNINVKLEISLLNPNNNNCMTSAISEIKVEAKHENQQDFSIIHSNSTPALDNNCPDSYNFDWYVTEIGDYQLIVSTKHGNDYGYDEETVTFGMISAEYPAPPSVANGIINNDEFYKTIPGKIRGCIISKIAGVHASAKDDDYHYGPKGGPYDEDLIASDINAFYSDCLSSTQSKK
ncbi:hypothetical protein [Zobellella denitrificans]|uniref:hypothetical protein n=1 Tax=Zobellella denitrificans TaxID=347534 RepID=UPI00115D272E|nr:hypothetical protein [Zobellella denitrificans]